jgi:hypothetical protein
MSGSFVQKATAHGSAVTSITTVGMNTTTGNTVAVSIGSGPDFTSLTENGSGNTQTAIASPSLSGLTLSTYCYQNINGKSGHTFTANFSPADYVSMTASELTGVTASSLDTGSVASGSDTTSPYTVTSGTFAQADEIVILFNEPYAGGTSTFSESTGFTSIGGENDNNNYCGNWQWYKNISSTSALTPSVTDSTGTGYTGMLLVVAGFKSASSGTSVSPGNAAITLSGPAPTIAQTANQSVSPAQATVTLNGPAPTITLNQIVSPANAAISLTGPAPSLAQTANQAVSPGVAALSLSGPAPTITQASGSVNVSPNPGTLTITGYAPGIGQSINTGGGVFYPPGTWHKTKRKVEELAEETPQIAGPNTPEVIKIRAPELFSLQDILRKEKKPSKPKKVSKPIEDDEEDDELMLLL